MVHVLISIYSYVELGHEGQYVCRVGNEGGYSQEKVFLRVQGKLYMYLICVGSLEFKVNKDL